jgi:hypothetical protein
LLMKATIQLFSGGSAIIEGTIEEISVVLGLATASPRAKAKPAASKSAATKPRRAKREFTALQKSEALKAVEVARKSGVRGAIAKAMAEHGASQSNLSYWAGQKKTKK